MSKVITDNDLVYSAYSRCPCGAGLAYKRNAKPNSDEWAWDCSAILKGVANDKITHTAILPFVFWEIKSELQPSVNGATTRP